ncbi:hypothetical protein B0919_20205 [Hymenobacter sp. CRA2]|nr:hypothetical protein B0919_20205 [Hymenobacter sp. CRA2]
MPARDPQGINGNMRAAHVGLRTPDYEGTIQWYSEKLGFRVLQQWTVGDLRLAFLAPANDDTFWLEVLSDGAAKPAPASAVPVTTGFQHLCLEVDNLDHTLAALRERDVKVIREPFNVPAIGKRCGFVADLHGNVIEFAENLR